MRLQIPGIGDVLKLTEPWKFTIIPDRRNAGMYEHISLDKKPGGKTWRDAIDDWRWRGNTYNYQTRTWTRNHEIMEVAKEVVTLPAGVKLVVDRLYFAKVNTMYRGGHRDVKDFHSVTFIIPKNSNILGNKKQIRFFVSLAEANQINYELASTDEEYTGKEIGAKKTKSHEELLAEEAAAIAYAKNPISYLEI